jgi:hypothetical protein
MTFTYCYKSDKIMLQLLRYLIFGKQCQHQWKLEKEMKPFTNVGMYLYSCQKCGKMKKVKFDLARYQSSK